ncbi:hypothetical protein OIU85_008696 [Salix viminalis]|uniref:Uncharacterized protein n=1 Tax=Salix viminalis TaxID=40686 RepID=A0A9Q0NY98_SALVM|nr:hypothetical protein OIU85_008696 [Salix viminalis]
MTSVGWCSNLVALKELPEQSRSIADSGRTTMMEGRRSCEGDRGAEGEAEQLGEEGTPRDLGTVEFAREMGLQWVRWSEKKNTEVKLSSLQGFGKMGLAGLKKDEKKRSEIVEFAREMGCNLLV